MRSAIGFATGLGLVGCKFNGGALPPPTSEEVTGTFVSRIASNDTDLVPVVTDVPAIDGTLRFRFDDGSETEATIDDNGDFTVPRPTPGYTVELAVGSTVVELREDADQLVLGTVFAGRVADPVTLPTPIRVTMFPSPSPIVLASIGHWSSTSLIGQQELDWRSATPTGGIPIGLLESATDRLFAFQYEDGAFAVDQLAIARVVSAAVDMKDGAPVDLSDEGALPVVPDTCVRLDASSELVVSRFVDSIGPGYDEPLRRWSISATPSLETLSAGSVTVTSATTQSLDFTVEAPFGDPLPNHELLVNAIVTAQRTLTLQGSTASGGVIDGVLQVYPADHADKCDGNTVDVVDVGVPVVTGVELGGIALVADHQVVAVPRPDDVRVSWEATVGAADFFDVQLLEVMEENDKLQLVVRRAFRTRLQELSIAESLLVSGRSYAFRVMAAIGHPGAAEGNYLDIEYPASSSLRTSPVFRVE